ncbi:hypothetical protein SprV_0200838600 [Sparganum proliferum]
MSLHFCWVYRCVQGCPIIHVLSVVVVVAAAAVAAAAAATDAAAAAAAAAAAVVVVGQSPGQVFAVDEGMWSGTHRCKFSRAVHLVPPCLRSSSPCVDTGSSNELTQRLSSLPVAAAAAIEENTSSTALAVFGRARRQHQDWFDDNDAFISSLLVEKNRLHKAYDARPIDDKKQPSTVVAALCNSGCERCRTLGRLARPRISKGTPTATNGGISSPRSRLSTVRQPKELHLFPAPTAIPYTPRRQITQRWAEHFRVVLNRPFTISGAAIVRLFQVKTNFDLDFPLSLHETIKAVKQFSSGKAPGSGAIPAEICKLGGPQLMDHLTALFEEMWRQGEVSQDFKNATIVNLYKRKANHQICDNERDISLLNIVGKSFVRILLNCLSNHLK